MPSIQPYAGRVNNILLDRIRILKREQMETLKYKVIKTEKQYEQYCNILEELHEGNSKNKQVIEETELLTFLIKKWDDEHNTFTDVEPIVLLRSLMTDHKLRAKDMVDILGVSKGLVSDILAYKKGLSKEIIRTLATHFSVTQEAFNRPYKLVSPLNAHLRNASVMNTMKELEEVG